ncbi:MAG: PEGA domain-containing protein [Vicinamibacterales bacterium]
MLVEAAGDPRASRAGPVQANREDGGLPDALDAHLTFRDRSPGRPDDAQRDSFVRRRRPRRFIRVALVLGLMAASGALAAAWMAAGRTDRVAATPPHGTLVLSSQPPGAAVVVDGVAAGTTPLAVDLPPGEHAVVATGGNGVATELTPTIAAGETAARHVLLEAPSPRPDAAGVAPQPAPPTAGREAAALPGPSALPGYIRFDVPFAVEIYEDGRLLGSSGGGPLRMAAGVHTLTLVNQDLGYRSAETVAVTAGRETSHVVGQQTAPLSIHVLPWAEVSISGRGFGTTPVDGLMLPIGTYQLTLRHPTLGERDVPITVRLGAENRVDLDLRR